jgi:hypothetical protein
MMVTHSLHTQLHDMPIARRYVGAIRVACSYVSVQQVENTDYNTGFATSAYMRAEERRTVAREFGSTSVGSPSMFSAAQESCSRV